MLRAHQASDRQAFVEQNALGRPRLFRVGYVSLRPRIARFLYDPVAKPAAPIRAPAPAIPKVDATVSTPATGPSNKAPPAPPMSQPDWSVATRRAALMRRDPVHRERLHGRLDHSKPGPGEDGRAEEHDLMMGAHESGTLRYLRTAGPGIISAGPAEPVRGTPGKEHGRHCR